MSRKECTNMDRNKCASNGPRRDALNEAHCSRSKRRTLFGCFHCFSLNGNVSQMFSDFIYANSIFNIYWGNGPGQWQSRMIRVDVSAFLRADNIYTAWQSTTHLSFFQISRNILLLHTHTQQSGYKGWRSPVLPLNQWHPRTIAGISNDGSTERVLRGKYRMHLSVAYAFQQQ